MGSLELLLSSEPCCVHRGSSRAPVIATKDCVSKVHPDVTFFRKGDTGIIKRGLSVEGFWVDFNENIVVYQDGLWAVRIDDIELLGELH